MKELLIAIKNDLKNNLSYLKNRVYIIPDKYFPPAEAIPPFVGIKDGKILREYKPYHRLEKLHVSIYAYVAIEKEEASVIGDNTQKGVLEIISDIHERLNKNTLSLQGIYDAQAGSEEDAGVLFEEQGGFMLCKGIEFLFFREINE